MGVVRKAWREAIVLDVVPYRLLALFQVRIHDIINEPSNNLPAGRLPGHKSIPCSSSEYLSWN
jgi:hypothetical protein